MSFLSTMRFNNSLGLLLAFSFCLNLSLIAQVDSSQNALQDSLLAVQQKESKSLLRQADSIQAADSIAEATLKANIAALQSSEAKEKVALQAQLDSLQKAKSLRENRIRKQVDSLRANTAGMPVVLFGDTLFYIYTKLGPFSPSDRAQNIVNKLEMLVEENLYREDLMQVFAGEESHDLMHEEIIVFSVTDRDAFWQNSSRAELAAQYLEAAQRSIRDYKSRTGLWSTLKRIALLLLVIAGFFFGIRYLNRGFSRFIDWFLKKGEPFINGLKIKDYEVLSQEREEQLIAWVLNILKWLLILLVLYLSLPVLFSIFPATAGIAGTLIGYVLDPLKSFGLSIISYIPELITIILIAFLTRYFVRFLKFLSTEVAEGKLEIPGFYPDWAGPTFNLLKIIIYAFAFVMIFPYLPGSESPVFQGVSVFLGLLISLGSSSAISNIIAGLVITYMRAFKIGDRVKIGDTSGDVIEKTMLVTRLRTIKNEDVTIPNSSILNGSTVNYSSSAEALGLILNTTVTIGYDVPWPKVHELLIAAARKAQFIESDPPPFVLQTSLDDFYVSYQLNAYTKQAKGAAKIYSEIHSNIQDAFNEAGIEILSPHYRAARDANVLTIPPQYIPPGYKSGGFKVEIAKDQTKDGKP
jgi:small-conductance mechanosensitive channel